MKKFNIVVLLLAVAYSVSAQPFQNTWYNYGNWPSSDAPEAMADVPYEGKTTVAKKAEWTVDIDMLDEIGIQDIWDRLGDDEYVDNLTNDAGGDSYDLDGDATFGVAFKNFWTDDMLYTVLMYKDVNSVAVDGSRTFEISFQLRDIDRYEAGYQITVDDDSSLRWQNMQYGAYIELGAGKALFTPDGVTETVRLIGQEGAWGSSVGAGGTLEYNWTVDQDGTIWAVLGMAFDDYLLYMDDEWGAYEAANYVSLDPTVTTKISFEVKSNALVAVDGEEEDQKMEYWWSSNDNLAYQSVYYNGYLEFSEETFFPVSAKQDVKASDKLAYIYDNVLRFKGFENPIDVEVYSIVGQKVMSAKNINTLNVSDLEKGIYLIKVAGEKQAFKVMK
jgi:hypothetical protein